MSVAHNIAGDQKANEYIVRLLGDETEYGLKVLYKHVLHDLLLIKIESVPPCDDEVLKFCSVPLKTKDKVVAIGYEPLNVPSIHDATVMFEPSIMTGVITCPLFKDKESHKDTNKAACTCATVQGNSGCPILLVNGEVVGVLTQLDGTSREIITTETMRIFLLEYLQLKDDPKHTIDSLVETLTARHKPLRKSGRRAGRIR
ncbi:uncharacterized protein LOC119367648 [Triticum dicoccoides]|uniref:uncharacterized protein LOC119367648 n=1 Tax=Triticum dicoccoides TaxID=85692 RepID=UPI00188DC8BD|nr:uncharacterized protein LOC119367648 [Triticum dicoccoides]